MVQEFAELWGRFVNVTLYVRSLLGGDASLPV